MFLFLARLRFPAEDSIITILQTQYGDDLVTKVWKLEKGFWFGGPTVIQERKALSKILTV